MAVHLCCAAALDQFDLEAAASLCQVHGQVGIQDVLLQGIPKATAAHAGDDLAILINRLAAIDLGEVISIQNQGAQLAFQTFLLLFDQGLLTDKILFVEIDAEAQSALIRSLELGDIGSVVAITLFKTQGIKHLVAADLDAEFLSSFNQRIPNQRSTIGGDIQFPTQLADIADTLRPDGVPLIWIVLACR